MVDIGIMLEGQEDLSWERFFHLATAVEELGFDSLFRSDHLTPLEVDEPRQTLALWPSLAALALKTRRIRFGPLVCPITFRHPAMLAKMAVSVSALSGGRLDLGIGAGWFPREHQMFGIPYPRYGDRLAMLAEGAEVIRALWSGEPRSFAGAHYSLDGAQNHAGFEGGHPALILGGKGQRTLQIVARYADEWNFSYQGPEAFRTKSEELDAHCSVLGRDPAEIRRSVMVPFVIGRDLSGIQNRIDAHRRMFPSLPRNLGQWVEAGFVGGNPDQVAGQLAAYVSAGVDRFMLQHNDLDDRASLELLADEVLVRFR